MTKINRYFSALLAVLCMLVVPVAVWGDTSTSVATLSPLSLSAQAESSTSILLSWEPPIVTSDATIRTYRVYRDEAGTYKDVGVEVNPTVRRWEDLGRAPNTTYYYCVKTEFTDGTLSDCASTYAATLTQDGKQIDPITYPAPTDLTMKKTDSDSLTISWSRPITNTPIEGYYIYRTNGDTSKQIAGPLGDTYYTDQDLAAGSYAYRVQAVYVDGTRSALSSSISSTVSGSTTTNSGSTSSGSSGSNTSGGASGATGVNVGLNPYQSIGGKGGLVPCDGPEYKPGTEPAGGLPEGYDACGYYDLVDLIQNIVNYMIILMTFAATLLFVYAGWLYLTSGGNPGKKSQANKIFKQVGIGIVIVLSAWIIINTIISGLDIKSAFNPLD